MPRRTKPSPPKDWVIEKQVIINGRHVTSGSEVSIRGERGRFRFMQKVIRPERGVEWLDFWGGPKGREQWRSFHEGRVKRVHRIRTTGRGLLDMRSKAASSVEK